MLLLLQNYYNYDYNNNYEQLLFNITTPFVVPNSDGDYCEPISSMYYRRRHTLHTQEPLSKMTSPLRTHIKTTANPFLIFTTYHVLLNTQATYTGTSLKDDKLASIVLEYYYSFSSITYQ